MRLTTALSVSLIAFAFTFLALAFLFGEAQFKTTMLVFAVLPYLAAMIAMALVRLFGSRIESRSARLAA